MNSSIGDIAPVANGCFQYASFDETGSGGVFIENAILSRNRPVNAIGAYFSRRNKSNVFVSQFISLSVYKILKFGFRVCVTNATSFRIIVFLCLFLLLDSQAEDTAVLRQDFENRLPGQTPEGWVKTWGSPLLEDVFTTSNMDALSGNCSLMLERQRYEKPGQYGLSRLTSPINANAAAVKLVIPFLLKAPTAYCASFSILLRSTKSSMNELAELRVSGGKASLGKVKKGAGMGGIEFGVWHRFVVILPLEAGKGKNGSAVLERKEKDGSWKQCGDSAELELLVSIASDRRLSIQIVPGSTGEFQLLMDDLLVEPVSTF